MAPRRNGDLPWQHTARAPGPGARDDDELDAPRTQLVPDRDAYLGQGRSDVGRRISDDEVELFISADVAGALQQEFTRHAPEFVALHDLGTSASLRLLNGLAGAAGQRVQRLSIRRQGHGVALAVLPFVEVPPGDGKPVRVFGTDFVADAAVRAAVARVLLSHSRLGVLLVGELAPNALAGQLAPLREAVQRGPWPNRDLLLLPLASSMVLAPAAAQLAGGGAVAVQVAPLARKPQDAWNFIAGAWNRLQGRPTTPDAAASHALPTDMARAVLRPPPSPAEAPTEPMPLEPAGTPAQPTLPDGRWLAYAERCAQIKGCMSCCVFVPATGEVLAHAGGPPSGPRLAQRGAMLLTAAADAARALGLGGAADSTVSATSGEHHLLLHRLPGRAGVAVHLLLLAGAGNVVLARMQLERIEAPPA